MERSGKSNRSITLHAVQNQKMAQETRDTSKLPGQGNRSQGEAPLAIQGHLTEEELREILKLAEVLAREFARKHGIYHMLDELVSTGRYAIATAVKKIKSGDHYGKYIRLRIRGELISFWRKWTDFSKTKKTRRSLHLYLEEVFHETQELGITQGRVSQLHREGIEKLRGLLR